MEIEMMFSITAVVISILALIIRGRTGHQGYEGAAGRDGVCACTENEIAEKAWEQGRASANIMFMSNPPQEPKNPYKQNRQAGA